MPKAISRFLVVITTALLVTPLLAQTYESGHQALQIFNDEAMANMPLAVKIWVNFMLASFALGLLFVWKRVEARWLVGGMLVTIVLVAVVLPALELTRLSGLLALIHLICWSPALVSLLTRRTFLKERSLYAWWCGLVTVVIIISFVFDVRDAFIYIGHIF